MTSNTHKSEVLEVPQDTSLNLEHKKLLNKLATLSAENQLLCSRVEELEQCRTSEADRTLRLAEYIIDNSPAILFRRLAAERLEDRKMVYVSPNISRFGYRAEDILSGKVMFRDLVYEGDTERTKSEIDEFVRQGRESYSQYYRIVTKSGEIRWVEDRTSVIEDEQGIRYHQGILIDIHRRKEAEEQLRRSEEKYRRIVDTTGEGFILMDNELHIVDSNDAFAKMVGESRTELIGSNPFENNVGTKKQLLSGKAEFPSNSEYQKVECQLPASDGSLVPVLIHANTLNSDGGDILGIMAFITDMTEQKKALALAGEVQRSLLPDKPPDIEHFQVAGRNIACEEVGGDYFDYLMSTEDGENRFSAVVGDITGHGVDSALLMSSARAFLRMRASQAGTNVDIIRAMNRHLSRDVEKSGRFMTLFYLSFDNRLKSLEWIRAGHDPALRYDPADDSFEELKGPGLALGVDLDYEYTSQQKSDLQPNQIFLIYTDGLWEACNEEREMYGKQRLKDCLRRYASLDAQGILENICSDQLDFCNGVKNEDDLTLVVVKYTPADIPS